MLEDYYRSSDRWLNWNVVWWDAEHRTAQLFPDPTKRGNMLAPWQGYIGWVEATAIAPPQKIGDVWWLPDAFTHYGSRMRHPWVVVQPYSPRRPTVVACPRTTRIQQPRRGIMLPGGILDGLDRPGLVVLTHRRVFVAQEFRNFDYLGRLPADSIKQIQVFNAGMIKGRAP